MPQRSQSPYWPYHQLLLANCDWMPASYTSGQPSHSRRHLTCWASSQRSYTFSRTPCHGAWTSDPLNSHLSTECECTAPQIETPIYSPPQTTHQFISQQQHTCGAVGGSLMKRGVVEQHYETPYFNPRHRHPPSQEEPGSGLTRTGLGRFRSCLYKWVMASSAACECGAEEQTVDHVVLQCPIHRPPHGLHGLMVLDDETIEWLLNTCPEI